MLPEFLVRSVLGKLGGGLNQTGDAGAGYA